MRTSALALLGLSLLVACGDDGGNKGPGPDTLSPDTFDAYEPDTAKPDTYVPDTAEVVEPRVNTFTYDPAILGSNGAPCSAGCALRRFAGEDLDLAVYYRDGFGQPLVDRQIFWNAGEAPTDLASLSAFSAYTDAQGRATVKVRSGGLTGSLTVTARVSGDDTVSPLEFVITFDAPPQPDLAASFEYVGQAPLVDFQLRLYEQRNGQPTCASVHPDAAPIPPTLTGGPYERGQQARIQTLPGLATAGQQSWVVQFIGPFADDAGTIPLAVGCVDGVVAKAGQTATALVYILDLPKHFRGVYTTLTRLDTLSGGEGTAIGDTLITLSELFTRPGTLLVKWACQNPTGTLDTVCGWITDSSGDPNFLGSIIVDAADSALLALFEQAVGPDIQDASELISEMLRDLRLVANTTFANEPATSRQGFPGAYFAPGDASEEWTFVRFRWKLDPNCKNTPNPDDCGWSQIPLHLIYGSNPTAVLDAGVDQGLALHITPHEVSKLTYGPLINYIIEHRILPLVFASGGDEPVDSWDDFVATLFGDRLCLDYDDCCEYFADRLEETILSSILSWESRVAACEIGIPLVAGLVRNQLTRLDGALNVGTFAGQPCPSSDGNSDRWIDGYGLQSTCDWDLYFPINGARFEPDNDWRSARQ